MENTLTGRWDPLSDIYSISKIFKKIIKPRHVGPSLSGFYYFPEFSENDLKWLKLVKFISNSF
jgi:hypothetical protein